MDEWRKEPFLHTILNLLEWNSANQKFKNYANPTNLANFWMPMMLLCYSNGPHYAPYLLRVMQVLGQQETVLVLCLRANDDFFYLGSFLMGNTYL